MKKIGKYLGTVFIVLSLLIITNCSLKAASVLHTPLTFVANSKVASPLSRGEACLPDRQGDSYTLVGSFAGCVSPSEYRNLILNIGLDIRPRFNYLIFVYPWDGGITIRYVFNSKG